MPYHNPDFGFDDINSEARLTAIGIIAGFIAFVLVGMLVEPFWLKMALLVLIYFADDLLKPVVRYFRS